MAVVRVVVGVIINNKNQVLIAKRATHQHQGDKWEFPGGKVENDESPTEALTRELKEELGVEIQSASHLIDIRHTYIDKTVHLEVFEIRDWQGEPEGREGQPLRWVKKSVLHQYKFPAANAEILSTLSAK
ncbi:MAG: 8-oxo-dGTP diphosphatase MutT [Cocleimonas sp.]|nr:8-oxo-dGTP diphosphatase MutT [Cocleimonas sp.]